MVFDFIFIVFLLGGFLFGFRKGLVHAIISLFAVLAGIIMALKFATLMSEALALHTEIPPAIIPILSSILVFILVFVAVRLTGWVIDQFLKVLMMQFINKIFGGLIFAVLISIVFSVFTWLFDKGGFTPEHIKEDSKSYVYVIQTAPLLFDLVGNLLPFTEGMFESLQEFWQKIPAENPVKTS